MPDNPPDLTVDTHNTDPLDETTLSARDLLEKLQGNILKGHGRDFAAHIFFRFQDDPASIRKHLGDLAKYITSAYQQYEEADKYRRLKVPGGLFGMLALTGAGYRYLGYSPESFGERTEEGIRSNFAEGLKAHAVEDFNDPPVTGWDQTFREEIHALLLLAHHQEDQLMRDTESALQELQKHHQVLGVELGRAKRNAQGQGVEHFGFVDGRSQPLYLKTDFQYDEAGNRTSDRDGSAINIWDPFEPLHRVLVADPIMRNGINCLGSHLVFRKLEQNVRSFREQEKALAAELGLTGPEAERAGAMAIGRFRDGTPVAVSPDPVGKSDNNFAFDHLPGGGNDVQGLRCPLQAHIRKANPRGDIAPDPVTGAAQIERQRRIVRRGISYGNRIPDPDGTEDPTRLPSSGVGLLFMCFQAYIPKQFAFLQKAWCNNPNLSGNLVHQPTGIDQVIGEAPASPAAAPAVVPLWPRVYAQPPIDRFTFQGFVRMKGGEFFFAPSIPFFQMLKA